MGDAGAIAHDTRAPNDLCGPIKMNRLSCEDDPNSPDDLGSEPSVARGGNLNKGEDEPRELDSWTNPVDVWFIRALLASQGHDERTMNQHQLESIERMQQAQHTAEDQWQLSIVQQNFEMTASICAKSLATTADEGQGEEITNSLRNPLKSWILHNPCSTWNSLCNPLSNVSEDLQKELAVSEENEYDDDTRDATDEGGYGMAV